MEFPDENAIDKMKLLGLNEIIICVYSDITIYKNHKYSRKDKAI